MITFRGFGIRILSGNKKMKLNNYKFQIFVMMLVCFLIFIFFYNQYKINSVHQKMNEHVAVVKSDLWGIIPDGPVKYLTLASRRDNYPDQKYQTRRSRFPFQHKVFHLFYSFLIQTQENPGCIPTKQKLARK